MAKSIMHPLVLADEFFNAVEADAFRLAVQ